MDDVRDGCPLSARELQVLALATEGYSDKRIGEVLGISRRTVYQHLEKTRRKLACTTRTQAAVCAWRRGWLQPVEKRSRP